MALEVGPNYPKKDYWNCYCEVCWHVRVLWGGLLELATVRGLTGVVRALLAPMAWDDNGGFVSKKIRKKICWKRLFPLIDSGLNWGSGW